MSPNSNDGFAGQAIEKSQMQYIAPPREQTRKENSESTPRMYQASIEAWD